MPVIFKVTETFVLPEGSTVEDLADAIQEAQHSGFELRDKGRVVHFESFSLERLTPEQEAARSTRVWSLLRPAESAQQELPEQDARFQETADAELADVPNDVPSDLDVGTSEVTDLSTMPKKRPAPPAYPPPQIRCAYSGKPCHVCGLTRHEHTGKKFCSVKRARYN